MIKVVTIWILVFSCLGSVLRADEYIWPLQGQRRLSSSFSEFRDGHFHSGIDIRTYGRSGFPCLAVGRGEVRRLKIQPGGYGKALYLELEDGNSVVYAHLRCFNRALDSLLYFHRLKTGSSWCDIHIEPGRFVFSTGDTVAYTGRSGTTAAHLHFEIRDRSGKPINPLENFYSVPDRSSPVLSRLKVFPMGRGSRVNGSPVSKSFAFMRETNRKYYLADTLNLQGRFGLGISVWDGQGYGNYWMAPYSLELIIDHRNVYKKLNRDFSFSQTSEILLEYSVEENNPEGRYSLLFYRDGMTRGDRLGSGYLSAGNENSSESSVGYGLHRGRVVAVDNSGNSSVGEFYFWLHEYPEIHVSKELETASQVIVRADDPDGGRIKEELHYTSDIGGTKWEQIDLKSIGDYKRGWYTKSGGGLFRYRVTDDERMVIERYFASPETVSTISSYCECYSFIQGNQFILELMTDRALASLPTVRNLGTGGDLSSEIVQIGPRRYIAVFTPDEILSGLNIFEISGLDYSGRPLHNVSAFKILKFQSESRVEVELSDGPPLRFHAPRVRGEALCRLRELLISDGSLQEHERISPFFELEFHREYFPRSLHLNYQQGAEVVLLRRDDEKEWECVGVPFMEGGTVKLDRPGVYTFCRDVIPPRLDDVKVREREGGTGFFKSHIYYIPASDGISGIDPYSPKVIINGNEAVCEWDQIREYLCIPVPVSFPTGRVKMTVEISDRAGNWCVKDYSFVIR